MAKPTLKSEYDPVPQEAGSRSQMTRLASITSYWARLSKPNQSSYKDGVMGEMGHWTQPILFRWRASLWKTVWKPLIVYLLLYLAISLIYRYVLSGPIDDPVTGHRKATKEQMRFEKVVFWFKNSRQMPLTFLLGFYVSLVVKRWWEQYVKLPWPDEVATLLKAGVTKEKEEDKEGENQRIRRTVVRYLMLSYVLCLRRISSRVRREFSSMGSLVASGLLREDEREKIGEEDEREIGRHGRSNWWMPIRWSVSIVRKAMTEDRMANPPSYANLVKAIAAFRKGLTEVVTYGHVTVPLVYTQVVHLAVYFYFAISLVSRQWVQVTTAKEVNKDGWTLFQSEDPEELDLYIPIFLIFEFLFYMGWLNVASALYNPFGDDDDDFAVMDLMNRHIKVCMKIVDDDQDDIPELMDDDFWKPPPGSAPDWQPSMGQRLEMLKTEDKVKNQWSEIRMAAVDQKQDPEEEAICIEAGQ